MPSCGYETRIITRGWKLKQLELVPGGWSAAVRETRRTQPAHPFLQNGYQLRNPKPNRSIRHATTQRQAKPDAAIQARRPDIGGVPGLPRWRRRQPGGKRGANSATPCANNGALALAAAANKRAAGAAVAAANGAGLNSDRLVTIMPPHNHAVRATNNRNRHGAKHGATQPATAAVSRAGVAAKIYPPSAERRLAYTANVNAGGRNAKWDEKDATQRRRKISGVGAGKAVRINKRGMEPWRSAGE